MRKGKNDKVLRAIRPNVGIQAAYRAKMDDLIRQMQASYTYFLKAQYRETPPRMLALDATPAKELQKELRKLGIRWQKRFDEAAPKLAKYFALSASRRSDALLRKILKDGGFSVEFTISKAMRDILNATVAENVSLIRSIQQQYHTQIEGAVMRSVTAGRDLSSLTKELEYRYGVTRRRAANIALSQNNLATSSMTRARQLELGLKAKWLHSGGGKHPRPRHVKASGTEYDPAVGLPIGDKGQLVFPGQEPGCRCVSRSVVKGFS